MKSMKNAVIGTATVIAFAMGSLSVATPAEAAYQGWSKSFSSYSDCQWATSKKLAELRGKRIEMFHRCKWSTHPKNRNKWITTFNYWT